MVAAWQEELFQRRYLGVQMGLEAVRAAHVALGTPCADIPAIHVLGTNGKGSTSAMCAHALRHGRKVGLYTSPHLHRIGERVRVGGVALADQALQGLVARVLAVDDGRLPRPLTFFEILTLAALLHFETVGVDVMVLEAGLGGRLDATRIIRSHRLMATLFTPIDLDHTSYLGPDVTAIAGEKAAVLEDGSLTFSAPQVPEAAAVLQVFAMRFGVPLRFVEPLPHPPEGLPGEHQRVNAALALAGAQVIDPEVTASDLDDVYWPGRLERVQVAGGQVVFDVAHNPHGVAALVQHLRAYSCARTVLFGCLADKDAPSMLAELATLGCPIWLTTPPGGGYALDLLPAARTFPDPDAPGLDDAIDDLLDRGGELVICGSHHLVGHLRARLLDAEVDARWLGDPLARGMPSL